ncbi:MAG: outer membrane beta-barrel protein [Pseudomonadota bacterium]
MFALALLLSDPAWSQEAAVPLGPWDLYPTLGISVGYDDNLALSANEPQESEYVLLQPALRLETSTRRSEVRLQAALDRGEFTGSRFDDYEDFELSARWQYDPSVRSALLLAAARGRGHDRRGEGLRENFNETLDRDVDRYDLDSINGRYTYGAQGARGQLAVFAEGRDKTYRNNRDFTGVGDYRLFLAGAEFGWRVAPRTTVVARVTQADVDYDEANLDSEEQTVAVGVAWEAGTKTDGEVLVGQLDRDFDDPELPGFSGSFWELRASWRPKERTEVSVLSRRSTDEAFGGANFLVRRESSLSWRHNWRPRFVTAVDLAVSNEDFRPQGRDDDIFRVGISADYQFRRWMLVGAGLRRVERESTVGRFDYTRNELLLSVQLSL